MKSQSLTGYSFRLSLGAFVMLMLFCGSAFAQRRLLQFAARLKIRREPWWPGQTSS